MALKMDPCASQTNSFGTRSSTWSGTWLYLGSRCWVESLPTGPVMPCTPRSFRVFCGTRRFGKKLRCRRTRTNPSIPNRPEPRLHLASELCLVRWFARRFGGIHSIKGLLAQQSLQFSAGLVDHRGRELPRGFLPFLGEIFHPHVEE